VVQFGGNFNLILHGRLFRLGVAFARLGGFNSFPDRTRTTTKKQIY
jgi:hypothetical protein